jgi:hypothetical protein
VEAQIETVIGNSILALVTAEKIWASSLSVPS